MEEGILVAIDAKLGYPQKRERIFITHRCVAGVGGSGYREAGQDDAR